MKRGETVYNLVEIYEEIMNLDKLTHMNLYIIFASVCI